ncbi:MAG TPA: DUF4167 domain-containing protein [Sphingomicrobium sp.]
MINQRQGGRRRGRGGQRGQSLGGQPGNRQDNRQRGNAAQLLEKYKSLARDAQLAGDRVQTEYYLQYADHYFRVLSENRARFEDQRPRRGDDIDDDDGEELETAEGESQAEEREPRRERPQRRERGAARFEREDRSANQAEAASMNGDDGSLPLDVLPPAIGADSAPPIASGEGEEEESAAPRPRRRTRQPRRAESDDEAAPAA